jgi:hypothetical protein
MVIESLLSTGKDFRFYIFSSSSKTVLNEYAIKHPEKILLLSPVARTELIFELSKMDFLVNLDNGTSLNTPSKLIDYSLANRPIMNINPLNPDVKLLNEFLDRDYTKQLRLDDLQSYNIKNTIQKFLSLTTQHG